MARLTIGIPVYNGERYLPHTLDCLTRQTFTDFEVLIADNGSTDSTEQIVRTLMGSDPRFRYVRHETNLGVNPNFNYLFQATEGELFAWVAADDAYDERFFETCVALLDARPEAIGAFTATRSFDPDGVAGELIIEPVRWDHPDVAVRFGDVASFNHACLTVFAVYRREALARTELMRLVYGGDRLFLAEVALQGPIFTDPRPMFYNRFHPGRTTLRTLRGESSGGFVGAKALTWHYGRALWGIVANADLTADQRRRVRRALGSWAFDNRVKFARSAARAAIITGQQLTARRPGRRQPR